MKSFSCLTVLLLLIAALSACQDAAAPSDQPPGQPLRVLAAEGFLADITQNIAGERLNIETLIPPGLDPHSFEPTPKDVARIADSQVLVVNGAGLEEWLQETLDNAGGERQVIEASEGLQSRAIPENVSVLLEGHAEEQVDPHFWLDPQMVVTYVENIRDGLSEADPEGAAEYAQNAGAYIEKLDELDSWAQQELAAIPDGRRLFVTNHESFGYFADRFGFKIVGAVIPSVSSNASPSARQMVDLVELIRQTGAPAIFLETGANPELAQQVAKEAGVKLVIDLYTHSLTGPMARRPLISI